MVMVPIISVVIAALGLLIEVVRLYRETRDPDEQPEDRVDGSGGEPEGEEPPNPPQV